MTSEAKWEYSRINNFCLVTLTAIAITAALSYTKPVMVPFVLSVFVYMVASPAINWMQNRFKIPRIVAMALTLFFIVLISGTLLFFVAMSLDSFFREAAIYRLRVVDTLDAVVNFLKGMGLDIRGEALRREISNLPVLSVAKGITGGVISFVSNSVLIIIFVMFLLLGETAQVATKSQLIDEIRLKISRYVATKFFTSTATGILVGLLLWSLGVELALMFAVLTVFLNFIPSIGSIIATLLPLPILILQFGFGWQTITVLAISASVQFSIGNVIEPKIMGESMDLHPVAVLAFLIFWGLVWGLPGMFLAVPITAILKIILSRIPTTRNAAEILAGRIPESMG